MSVRQKGEKNSQSLEHKRLWWDEMFSKWNYCKCKRLGCTSDASSSKKHVRPTIITWVPHAVLTLYSFRFFLSFLIFILTTYENDNHTHHVPVSIQKNDICGYTWWHSKHKLCKNEKKNLKKKICIFQHYCIFRIRKRICISIWIFERWGCFESIWFLLNNKISRESVRLFLNFIDQMQKVFFFRPKVIKMRPKSNLNGSLKWIPWCVYENFLINTIVSSNFVVCNFFFFFLSFCFQFSFYFFFTIIITILWLAIYHSKLQFRFSCVLWQRGIFYLCWDLGVIYAWIFNSQCFVCTTDYSRHSFFFFSFDSMSE